MILALVAKGRKTIASSMLAILYWGIVCPQYALGASSGRGYNKSISKSNSEKRVKKVAVAGTPVPVTAKKNNKAFIGGPTQPESQAFSSVNNANMVDLFSGDFSYNIPLMDVGGYPLAIGYNSGISMDEEASWVGLGWNLNPGSITRNMRGLPDDFNGTDTIQKTANIKENKTVGVTVGADLEITGFPLPVGLSAGASIGVLHNSYKGWGLEQGFNVGVNAGSKSMGTFTAGLSITNSSQEGVTMGHTLSYKMDDEDVKLKGGYAGSFTTGLSYNSRAGMKALQFSAGMRQYNGAGKKDNATSIGPIGGSISFAYPSFTPTINLPYTSTAFSYTAKVGWETKVVHPSVFVSGYVSRQGIEPEDRRMAIPAYGYLNYQNANGNAGALLDYNREREIPYREKPAVPNIAVPSYTYDVFSMSGEGTGGMFRAYRGDIGYVHDHQMRTKDRSLSASLDIGLGDLVHSGVDLHLTRAFTESGPWVEQNPLAKTVAFRKSDKNFEASYFRNPGEKAINSKAFYNAIGGDDVVAVDLYQPGNSGPVITTTHNLNRYRNKRFIDKLPLSSANVYRATRDKRTQVISYLTAREASVGGLSKYIENYTENKFGLANCTMLFPEVMEGQGVGLKGEYFADTKFQKKLFERIDTVVNFRSKEEINLNRPVGVPGLNENFSIRWTGRLKVDVTGVYKISTTSDDGVRLFLNDKLLIDNWSAHPATVNTAQVNLVAGQVCDLKLEYYQGPAKAAMQLQWEYVGLPRHAIGKNNLYLMPVKDTFVVNDVLSREKRVNDFRKTNHISEIDVLNPDGKRYVYGLPVYNLKQKDLTFSVDPARGSSKDGLVKYTPGLDNTVDNNKGNDHYFNSEEIPAYAHSFLLTGIVSSDYVDYTGDGISDDDAGDGIRFNYTKIAGIRNPYTWRTPYSDSASYNEGLKTDNRDDKASYVYGEKELWYLHSIESKNMIATFKISEDRDDQQMIDENGTKKTARVSRKLDEINLYVKADFLKYNTKARPVKTVHFDYTHELCKGVNKPVNNQGKLTLKRIWFTYNGNEKGKKNPYVFNYNSHNPDYNGKSYDRWGNYKDPLQNPGSSSGNLISNAEYPYALQDSALAAKNAAAWTLDSIILPAGGRIKVAYESDDYAYVQNRRAMQMYQIAGFSATKPNSLGDVSAQLYGAVDNLFVAINVPKAVSSDKEVYSRYLEGAEKLFFRLNVKMPADKFGSGNEYVNCYATPDPGNYGYFNNGQTIWLRLKAIDDKGKTGGLLSVYSPLAKAAIQFLRLNLPSKAYPGSDVGDDLSLVDGVKVLLSQTDNLVTSLAKFDHIVRLRGWAKHLDLSRSTVRLNNPYYKKYGGGLRVKSIKIYDHWNSMTKQKESVYGHEYQYTTTKMIDGVATAVSSGVAAYEPILGGEENPWRQPIEYVEQVAALAPINMGYTEEPMGESLFPSPSVGYSKVRVRSLNTKNTRSANGYEETNFYTSYDFPTLTDMTLLADSKKRFKPALANFLRINARHFVAISQGFKVELNDMSGKVKSQATYPETDPNNPVSYTENFYKVDNQNAVFKHLNNTVMAIAPNGTIDPEASIGKDVELMLDMREQHSVTNANNFNINGDFFTFSIPPVFLIPMLLNLAQREETLFRSVGATKVINRHGLLDSVVVIEKGSRITTRNLLYNGETGDPVLTSTQNEFNDPLFTFSYPAGWAYDGMSGAYRNIGVELNNISISQGKITSGITASDYFTNGDEILIASKEKVAGADCAPVIATFPSTGKIYAIDANAMNGGAADIYFMDQNGAPFTGNDVSMKIIRSGRKNITASAGEVTSLGNPLVQSGSTYSLAFNTNTKVIAASAVEYKQYWKVADKKKAGVVTSCVATPYSEYIGDAECGVGVVLYGNDVQSSTFTRNDCGEGLLSGQVLYTVPANSYSSTISKEDANAQALADIAENGQVYANIHGTCGLSYSSVAIEREFIKNNCGGTGQGSSVPYSLAAGAEISAISQADADAKASARADVEGQANANTNGICAYLSAAIDKDFTKNDCELGGTGSVVHFQKPAGTYVSYSSQVHADQLADEAGQANANANGTCTFSSVAISTNYTKNDCTTGGIGSTMLVEKPAGSYTSTISQADADLQAQNAAQEYANTNGTCTYSSAAINANYPRSNCAAGGVGSTIPVAIPAGSYTSMISQADADQQAQNAAQSYANTNGICTYSSAAINANYIKNNCTSGMGSTIPVTIPAGTYTSLISQADADQQAQNSAQDYANTNGTCSPYSSAAINANYTKNDCVSGNGTSLPVSIPAGAFTSLISQADADQKAQNSAQDYANEFGECIRTKADITLECASFGEKTVISMFFDFPTTPTTQLTILFGVVEQYSNGTYGYVGSNIFTPPSGSVPAIDYPSSSIGAPFIVTIPDYTVEYPDGLYYSQSGIFRQGFTDPTDPLISELMWSCNPSERPIKHLYIKVIEGSYEGGFNIINPGIQLHIVQ